MSGLKKSIKKGQEWMKKSKNPTHDYTHASNVSKYALEIFQSLKDSGWEIDDDMDEDLVLITTWWHDCFKSLYSEKKIYIELIEGFESVKIAEKELEGILNEKKLKRVLDAIRVHNNVPYFLFRGKRLPILTRILIEADALDAKNKKRKKILQKRSFLYKIAIVFVDPFVDMLQTVYIKSPYAKIKLKEFSKKNDGVK